MDSALTQEQKEEENEVSVFHLRNEEELRFETGTSAVALKLLSGTAEIWGCELASNVLTHIPSYSKTALFTWHGCDVELHGECEVVYTADDTPMVTYANVHSVLEQWRRDATDALGLNDVTFDPEAKQQKELMGPCCMIVGATDSGKSSLARLLLNYAVRMGRKPTYVELDPADPQISVPGCLSASLVEHCFEPDGILHHHSPLVYFYGHLHPSNKKDLYRKTVENLSKVLLKRFENNVQSRISGCIINTHNWIDGAGFSLLVDIAQFCSVNSIIVLDHDRLFNQLKNVEALSDVSIVKLAKSGGVATRDAEFRRTIQTRLFHQYFYGIQNAYLPHTKVFSFQAIGICRLGGVETPSSLLPIGAKPLLGLDSVTKVTFGENLLHSILAASSAQLPEEISTACISGLLYITSIDSTKQSFTCLVPCAGPLPGKVLLIGTLKWIDQ